MRRHRVYAWLVCAACLAGCASRRTPAPQVAVQPPGRAYIDLEPGWRLRVVTPILKSGGYRLSPSQETVEGNTITLVVGDDFLGYETAYYAVKAHGVEFQSAETTHDGSTTPRPLPRVRLFDFPRSVRHVRLIFLVRASQADHDMAVAAAKDTPALEALTTRIQANPTENCRSGGGVFCAWIPAGIAVVPEAPRPAYGGGVEWAPVR